MAMSRKLALMLACLLGAPGVQALGLGNLETKSGLNQPFEARISLLGATADEVESLRVTLADFNAFERAGIEFNPVLVGLRFEVVTAARGADYIRVYSAQPVREPFLNFLLELNWAKGRLLREYTVLLDPPLYEPARPAVIKPAKSVAIATTEPARAAPPAAPAAAAPAPATPSVARAASPASAAATTDRPIQSGDTLWSVAGAAQPAGVTRYQMMVALLRANPDAFLDGNVNGLKRGYVLRMPAADAAGAIPQSEALALIREQQGLWEEYRQGRARATGERKAASAGAAEPAQASSEPSAPKPEGELKLVAPTEAAPGATQPSPETSDTKAELALATEQLESRKAENAELQDRLKEAETLISDLQRAVKLKDDELAALQARLAQPGNAELAPAPEATAPAQPEPTSAEPAKPAETPAPEAPALPAATAPAQPEPTTTEPAKPAEEPAPEAPAAPSAAEEAKPEATAPAAIPAVESPAPTLGLLDSVANAVAGLLPSSVTDVMPGGPKGVLGVLAALLLLIAGAAARPLIARRQERPAPPLPGAAPARPAAERQVDADFNKTLPGRDPVPAASVSATASQTAEDLLRTARFDEVPEQKAPASVSFDDDDPLAEVNVYLAYERFDQAEELVRQAIARHPNDPKYRLRLLEVYYSSNNKRAYEDAARELHDVVGGTGPLWDSAVAMWNEMSPERPLFAAPPADAPVSLPATDAGKAFVDVTGDEAQKRDELLTKTVIAAPMGAGTLVGGATVSTAALDFELAGETARPSSTDDILDITASGPAAPGAGEVLDLTSPDSASDLSPEVLDITAAGGEEALDEVLDLTATAASERPLEELDLTATASRLPQQPESLDLLDVTRSGAEGALVRADQDLLDLTSPGSTESLTESSLLDITGGGASASNGNLIEFDLAASGDEAPAAPHLADATLAGTGGDLLGLTAAAPEDQGHDALEFDVTGLGDLSAGAQAGLGATATQAPTLGPEEMIEFETVSPAARSEHDDATLRIDVGADAAAAASAEDTLTPATGTVVDEGDALEFDVTSLTGLAAEPAPAPGAVSEESQFEVTPVDLDIGADIDLVAASEADTVGSPARESTSDSVPMIEELDLSFDSGDLTELGPDANLGDTVELPQLDSATIAVDDDDASLEELSMALEDTISGLQQRQLSGDDSLDLDLDAGLRSPDLTGAETMELSASDFLMDEQTEQTVAMPRPQGALSQREIDEVDTRLNLAKAYMELGDTDGARSILEEVIAEGTPEQKQEASALLGQSK